MSCAAPGVPVSTAQTSACIQVVPHLGGVVTMTSPGRSATWRQICESVRAPL